MIQREDHGWRLPVERRAVSRCTVDHAFTLELLDDEVCIIRIEGDFSIMEGSTTFRLATSDPRGLGPALALFGQVIRRAYASDDGELQIVFEDGRCLFVKSDARYEAWEIAGPSGMRAVCTPSGNVVVWQKSS